MSIKYISIFVLCAALIAGISVYISSQTPSTKRHNQAMSFYSENFKDWSISRLVVLSDNDAQNTSSFKFELRKQKSNINVSLTCNDLGCTMNSFLFGPDIYE